MLLQAFYVCIICTTVFLEACCDVLRYFCVFMAFEFRSQLLNAMRPVAADLRLYIMVFTFIRDFTLCKRLLLNISSGDDENLFS